MSQPIKYASVSVKVISLTRDQISTNILVDFVNGLGRSNNNDVTIDDIIRAIESYDGKQFQRQINLKRMNEKSLINAVQGYKLS